MLETFEIQAHFIQGPLISSIPIYFFAKKGPDHELHSTLLSDPLLPGKTWVSGKIRPQQLTSLNYNRQHCPLLFRQVSAVVLFSLCLILCLFAVFILLPFKVWHCEIMSLKGKNKYQG